MINRYPLPLSSFGPPNTTVSLSKIRGFLAVAKHLNFRRAARELGITQPALSGQVKALEQVLGTKLFARTTRQVALTEDGARCLLRARRLMKDFEAGILEMRDPEEPPHGTVAFSCVPSVAAFLFPKLIRELRRRFPGVKAELTDDTTVAMERRLVGREVEFGIGGPPQGADDLEFSPVIDDPIVVVCRPDHPLARQRRVSVKRVLRYPIVALVKRSNLRTILDAHFSRLGYAFEPAYEMVHHYSIGTMVEAGLGIALLPLIACDHVRGLARFKIIEIDDATLSRPIGLLKRRGAALSPAARELYVLSERTIKAVHLQTQEKRRKTRPRRAN